MPAAGIDIAYVGNRPVYLIKQLGIQFDSQFPCDGRQMKQRIGGAAYGAVDDDGVAECRGRQYFIRPDIFFHKLHDFPPRPPCHGKDIPHGGRCQCAAGQRKPQRLRHALHGARRPHEGTCAGGRTACQLIITDFIRRNLIFPLLSQRNIARHKRGGLVRPGAHAAARNKNGGNIDSGRRLQMRRYGFVTGRGKQHPVPGHKPGMHLDHICDHFP